MFNVENVELNKHLLPTTGTGEQNHCSSATQLVVWYIRFTKLFVSLAVIH